MLNELGDLTFMRENIELVQRQRSSRQPIEGFALGRGFKLLINESAERFHGLKLKDVGFVHLNLKLSEHGLPLACPDQLLPELSQFAENLIARQALADLGNGHETIAIGVPPPEVMVFPVWLGTVRLTYTH